MASPDELKHGATHTYQKYGCRCDACYAAIQESRRKYNERHRAEKAAKEAARRQRAGEAGKDKTREYNQSYRANRPDELKQAAARRYRAVQDETQDRAHRKGYEWTGPEMEIAARADLTAKQVAEMLGRTFSGVMHIRSKLKEDPRAIALAGNVPDPKRPDVTFSESDLPG